MSSQKVRHVRAAGEQVTVYLQLQLLTLQGLQVTQGLLAQAPRPVPVNSEVTVKSQ